MLALVLVILKLLTRCEAFQSDNSFFDAVAMAKENSLNTITEDLSDDWYVGDDDSLSGSVVRVAYKNYYPHLSVLNNGTAIGLYGEVLMNIKAYFNVSIKWIESVDGNWGAKASRGLVP